MLEYLLKQRRGIASVAWTVFQLQIGSEFANLDNCASSFLKRIEETWKFQFLNFEREIVSLIPQGKF